MKKLLAIFFAVCIVVGALQFPVSAKTLDNGLMYVIEDGEAIISNYVGKSAEVVIPAEIDGCPVTAIGKGSFFENAKITSVSIPDSVEFIGENCFYGCASLEKINIGSS